MSPKEIYKNKTALFVAVILLMIIILGIYWISFLRVAHSSFENYYNFRGCIQLIEKTDIYGTCKISTGEIIKLVKVKDKWYLDGDLSY